MTMGPTPPPPSRPRRVILAEDDRTLRRLIASVLRHEGYEIVEARDGIEVLQQIEEMLAGRGERANSFLIVTDVCMPGLSGLDVLAILRCAHATTPVILITAFGDEKTYRRGLGARRERGVRQAVRRGRPADRRPGRRPSPVIPVRGANLLRPRRRRPTRWAFAVPGMQRFTVAADTLSSWATWSAVLPAARASWIRLHEGAWRAFAPTGAATSAVAARRAPRSTLPFIGLHLHWDIRDRSKRDATIGTRPACRGSSRRGKRPRG